MFKPEMPNTFQEDLQTLWPCEEADELFYRAELASTAENHRGST